MPQRMPGNLGFLCVTQSFGYGAGFDLSNKGYRGYMGYDPQHDPSPQTAAVLVNALYAAFDYDQRCDYFLHQFAKPALGLSVLKEVMIRSISVFDSSNANQLTAQLNAVACLARLCNREMEVCHTIYIGPGVQKPAVPWYLLAVEMGTFELAISSFMKAFEVCQCVFVWFQHKTGHDARHSTKPFL